MSVAVVFLRSSDLSLHAFFFGHRMKGMSAVAVNYRVACKRVDDLQFELKKAVAAKKVAAEPLQREERNKEREKLKIIASFAKAKPKEKSKMKGKAEAVKVPIVKATLCNCLLYTSPSPRDS